MRRGSRETPVVVYAAVRPDGARSPLVVFVPGFQLDSQRYAGTLQHIASHGFVVVRADPPDPLLGVSHTEMAADVRAVLDWALAGERSFARAVDGARVGVMGHSLGGKVATMVAFRDTRVGALFGVDPVNGGSPLTGYSAERPNIVPAEVSPLRIPVGFAGETTNGTGGLGGTPCAPAAQNFQTFFDAATSAAWAASWDFVGADHMDFLDDTTGCGFTCSACTAGTASPADVLAGTRTLAAAFFRRHFLGEAAMEEWLTGARVPAGITVRRR